jgi:hypothetical protein
MNLNNTLRHNMMGQITTSLTTTSRLLVYTGSAPSKTAAPTGTLLGTWTLASTPGTDTNGVYTFTAPANITFVAAGTPGYFRMIDGSTDDGTHTQIQGTAGVGSGELNFASAAASGGTGTITSMTITEGNP